MTNVSSSQVPSFAAGQKLAGCFVLQRQLGTWAEMPIWLAQDEVLGKDVTLHWVPPAVARDPGALAELRQEVKRTRQLIHPHILRVYDLVTDDGWAAISMDVFEGRSLAELQNAKEARFFEPDEVKPWIVQLCQTLQDAHKINLVHGHVAPANIFLQGSGDISIARFATSLCINNALNHLTRDADASRTAYASPQLLEGKAPTRLDDIYSTGVLLFELLTGTLPFSDGNLFVQVQKTVPRLLSQQRAERGKGGSIPAHWDQLVAACLEKDPAQRPKQMSDIAAALSRPTEPSAASIAPAAVILHEISGASTPALTAPVAVPEQPAASVPVATGAAPRVEGTTRPQPQVEAPAVESAKDERSEPALSSELPSQGKTIDPTTKPAPAVASKAASKSEPRQTASSGASAAKKRKDESPVSEIFPNLYPKRSRVPLAGIIVAISLIAVGAGGLYISRLDKTSESTASNSPELAATDEAPDMALTSVSNPIPEPPPIPEPVVEVARPPASSEPPANVEPPASIQPPPEPAVGAAPTPEWNPPLLAAAATPAKSRGKGAATPAPGAAPTPSGAAADPLADKTAAIERLKESAAAAEANYQKLLKQKQQAETAAAEAQKTLEEKTHTAAPLKAGAEEAAAQRAKKEEEQKAAELAAAQARQVAEEKARAAEEARKNLADFEKQQKERIAAQEKMNSELQTLEKAAANKQQAAADAARLLAEAESARQQQLAAIQDAERQLADAQMAAARAAEAERARVAKEEARKQIEQEFKELQDMKAAFQKKMEELEAKRRSLEEPDAAPGAPPTSPGKKTPAKTTPPPATPPPVTDAKPQPAETTLAMKTTPAPRVPPPPAEPPAVAGAATENSLGMKFVPVGDVQFCIWQTRVQDFETFAKAVNLRSTAWKGPGFQQGPDHPVVNVTWQEAMAFCKWLTDREHKDGTLAANQIYRLPTDLEWSKAAGLGEESGKTPEARDMGVPDVYPWGTQWPPPTGAGNYTGEETGSDVAIKGYNDGFAWTSPVGSFPPNKFGIYDMGGNVWQWCMDTWNAESKQKVLRGASWYNGALKLSLLSSCRVHAAPDSSTDNYGFRIVRASETPKTTKR